VPERQPPAVPAEHQVGHARGLEPRQLAGGAGPDVAHPEGAVLVGHGQEGAARGEPGPGRVRVADGHDGQLPAGGHVEHLDPVLEEDGQPLGIRRQEPERVDATPAPLERPLGELPPGGRVPGANRVVAAEADERVLGRERQAGHLGVPQPGGAEAEDGPRRQRVAEGVGRRLGG
jgi:hypothetical protein